MYAFKDLKEIAEFLSEGQGLTAKAQKQTEKQNIQIVTLTFIFYKLQYD